MPATITSSVLFLVSPQNDGRRWTHEVHTDSLGITHPRAYLADAVSDLNAAMTAWASVLLGMLGTQEINDNIAAVTTVGSLAAPTFNYSTVAQNVAALRAAYAVATQTQAVMIGDYLSSLTDVQLENAFSLTQSQVTTLRTNKLTPAANTAATIRVTTGQ